MDRPVLLAAGQGLLALNRFSAGAQPGSGGYLSLLLVAAAGLLFSIAALRDRDFPKAAGYAGLLANGLDLVYCATYTFSPPAAGEKLALSFIPAAGLFYVVWHVVLGWYLLKYPGRRLAAAG